MEEGYTILRSAKLVNTEYELYEELVRPYHAFTQSCRQILMRGVSNLIKEDAPLKSRSISRFLHFSHWLPFSAVELFLVDTNPIGPELGGNGNGQAPHFLL